MTAKPETDAQSAPAGISEPVGRWRLVAASVRGVSHERSSQPCQDAHAWRRVGEGFLVAAVADGAGSAAQSEIGAKIAAQSAIESLCAGIATAAPKSDEAWCDALKAAAVIARTRVEAEAERLEVDARELASTLIHAVAFPTGIAVAQIGDGAAVVRNRAGEISAVTTPQNGEYLNETIFVTSPTAMEMLQTVVWHGEPAEFALFSDGLQTIALSSIDGAPFAPFFEPLFRFVTNMTDLNLAELELASFLRSPRFEERTDDDLTLVLATLAK